MKKSLLTIEDVEPGIQKVMLNVDALPFDEKRREQFEKKLLQFLDSDPVHPKVICRINNKLVYLTENIIPKKKDKRSPLLLLFGNPASHSVASRMFFAFEGGGREHRLWKVLSKAGIFSFSSLCQYDLLKSLNELNQLRKRELFELSYGTPFRIGLAVFYTMPTPASRYPWAGVPGLYRLFGKGMLAKIRDCEKERVDGFIREFAFPDGTVIAFHKEAYQAIKSSESPDYTFAKAKAGHLIGTCQCAPCVTLLCVPPTRLLLGHLGLLRAFCDRIGRRATSP